MTKKIAVYGSYRAKAPVRQRYWKRRKDGVIQRYWKKTKRLKRIEGKGRYEFQGKGKDLYKAVVKAHRLVPKGYVDVSAKKFLDYQKGMVMKENGLTEKWNPKCVIGYTDTRTVMLDFDNTPFKQVKYWAIRAMEWFKLEGFIILRSSENNYHVLFNREVSWEENVGIMAWVCLITKHRKLTGWFILQCIKKGVTLRVSRKKGKPSPRIVLRHGKQDGEIRDFLRYRGLAKSIMRKVCVCQL